MNTNPDLGLIYISEQTSPEDNVVKNIDVVNKGNGVFYVKFRTCMHSFDVLNRNSRMYEASNIMDCIGSERIQHYLSHGGWYGEMDHPTPMKMGEKLHPDRINLIKMDNTSHRFLNPTVEGNLLMSDVETDSGTDAGMNLARKMVQGFIPGFSCRAIASMVNKGGKPVVLCRKVICYDWVLFQSHREAEQDTSVKNSFISKIANGATEVVEKVKTGANEVLIPLKEILKDVGRTDINTQVVMEAFDLSHEDLLGFSDDHEKIVIRDDNNYIYCNLDMDTKNKVNEYFRSF